ncbi:MAG: methionine--tRNA ligase [Verrucomicrobia bacterium]|nr:methionine--tRNA ligase [Verrucomicrobiota bacterium]
MSNKFYITTPIYYVNDRPHIGHAYCTIVADVVARAHRLMGDEVFFLTGLDEHGQKVQQAAQAKGVAPQQFCDEMAPHWRELWPRLSVSNDDFIRTTEPRHKAVVQSLLQKLYDAGEIYSGEYEGWYSARAEQFLTEKEMGPDGKFPAEYGEVVRLTEKNYFFKMSKYQDWLIGYIRDNPGFVHPDYRANELLGFLQKPLADLCISRPKTRLTWGIPLPFDPDHVTYVWFDALTNYVTAAGYGTPRFGQVWPADVHLIGKEILMFHACYWPIMLQACGIPLPRQVAAHGWWTRDGQKMSKSVGNVVDPVAVVDAWGADALRYYLLRELPVGSDGDWSDANFARRYNGELANDLGNLLNRALSMIKRYCQGVVPAPGPAEPLDDELKATALDTAKRFPDRVAKLEVNQLLGDIWELVRRGNQYVDAAAPWALAKDPAKAARLGTVLYNLAETCRIIGILLAPFMPSSADKIRAQLGVASAPAALADAQKWGALSSGGPLGEVTPLFPRRDK